MPITTSLSRHAKYHLRINSELITNQSTPINYATMSRSTTMQITRKCKNTYVWHFRYARDVYEKSVTSVASLSISFDQICPRHGQGFLAKRNISHDDVSALFNILSADPHAWVVDAFYFSMYLARRASNRATVIAITSLHLHAGSSSSERARLVCTRLRLIIYRRDSHHAHHPIWTNEKLSVLEDFKNFPFSAISSRVSFSFLFCRWRWLVGRFDKISREGHARNLCDFWGNRTDEVM